MAETLTDEQRLAEFQTKLDSFRPEGFEEENWAKLKEAVVGFHEDDVKQLKINSAKIKQEKTDLQAKYTGLETSFAESSKQIEMLNQQLKANQPDEQKKFFENQTAQLKGVYEKQISDLTAKVKNLEAEKVTLEKGVLERDVLADFNKAASEKEWLGGGREAAQKIAFTRLSMPDGTVTLIDKNTSKDIKTILNDFCGTELGKSFLRSGTSGGGADGSTSNSGAGKKLSEAQFKAMDPDAQMKAVLDGLY